MKDGELIRKLRKERNITQKKLVNEQYSRSSLARIEIEELDMKTDMLIYFLDRMNISLEEYQTYKFKSNSELSKKDEIKKDFMIKILNNTTSNEFIETLQDTYQQTNDTYYLHLYCLGRILQYKMNNEHIDLSEESNIIKKHLSKIESWGYFEFSMYTNSLFLFPNEFIQQQYKYVLQKIELFSNSTKFNHLKIRFLINSIIISLERNHLEFVDQYLIELFESTRDNDYILGRIFWKFFKDLKNKIEKNEFFDVTFTYNWLLSLGYDDLANNLLDIEKIINKNSRLKYQRNTND